MGFCSRCANCSKCPHDIVKRYANPGNPTNGAALIASDWKFMSEIDVEHPPPQRA
jgi:hypothetical protein